MIKRCAAILGAFTILFGTVSFYNASAATEGSTKFSVDTGNAVLQLSVPSNPAVINLNPTVTGGTFGSTTIGIKVATNNMTGYTLTMTPTNNQDNTSLIRTELVGSEQSYRTIPTLSQTDPVSTGYPESSFTANRWGYKITGNNYYGINPNNTTVSHPAWVTNAPTNETTHNLTLAAKVNAETTSGAYETTLNFSAVTNSVIAKHIISFDTNGGTGTMENLEVIAGTSATLPNNSFTAPSGMRFSGWSTTQNGQGNGVKYYTNKALYTASSANANQYVTLYAQWTNLPCINNCSDPDPDPTTGAVGTTLQRAYEIAYTAKQKGMWEEINPGSNTYREITDGHYYGEGRDVRFLIQDMTPEICASATAIESEAFVLDVRDQKSYWIAKLADNHCWMTQNLDLYLTHYSNDADATLTHANTDLGWTNYDPSAKWNPGRSTMTVTSNSDLSDWVDSYYEVYSADVGDWYWTDTWYLPETNNYLDNNPGSDPVKFKQTPFSGNGMHGHIGNYYNWYAAIADSNSIADGATTAPNSICPAGWKLPSVHSKDMVSDNDWIHLVEAYDANHFLDTNNDRKLSSAPIYLTRAGYILTQTLNYPGEKGWYWTSERTDNSYHPRNPYFFEYFGEHINTYNHGFYIHYSIGFDGQPVRCLAR